MRNEEHRPPKFRMGELIVYDNKIYRVRWYNLLPNGVWQYKLKSLSDEVLVEETLVSKYESTKKEHLKRRKK